jgi:glycosyltransferase involved in cell wall biosynthesis
MRMSKDPIVTIFLPVYNGQAYLGEAVHSLLTQSFTDFELIIIDDGSTDESVTIAESLRKRDERIRVIRGTHSGEVAARNKALSVSHPGSRFFLNHDSDDVSLPSKLQVLVQHLETHPAIAIAGCLAEYFNDAGQCLGSPAIELSPERIRATFHHVNSMINSSSLIRREVFASIGGYRPEFRSVDDYDFFMRALLAGFVLENVPSVLHRIRLHSDSIGSTRATIQQTLARRIQQTFLEHRDQPEPVIINSPLQLSRFYRRKHFTEPVIQRTRASRPARQESTGLRVLHTVQMYHPHVGGSEEVVKQLSEKLAARGHNVTVATGFLPERNFSQWNGVEIRQFNVAGNSVHGIRGDARTYQDFLLKEPFDVMMNYAAQIWASDLAFPILDQICGNKVFVPCGYSRLYDAAYNRYFENLPAVLSRYDWVVHLSSHYRDAAFSRKHGLRNSIVIGNAASEEEFLQESESFRRKYGIQTSYLIITVANHYPGKGHDRMLNWFHALGRQDATLAIIGRKMPQGCWDDCCRAAAHIPNVILFPDLARKDVVAAYKDADLFWFGSEVECFPLVILESMAAKTPWLSTDVGNVSELAGGWVAEHDHMVRKANLLLNSKSLLQNLGMKGFDQWKAHYTWQQVVDKYEQLYLSLSGTAKSYSVPPPRTVLEPLVSVVIPCFNQAQYLGDAVESVIEQTYRNVEIIIVDDGGPDHTKQVVEEFVARYPNKKIKLLEQDNQGLSASRNNGIRMAGGEYILPLDADDKIKATFLQRCIDELGRDPETQIVAVHLQEFGESSRTIACGDPVLERVAVANQINYCSLFPKALWQKVGGYKRSMRWGYEDWDFWISCLETGARVAVIPEPLFLYRKRGESMFTTAAAHSAELQAQLVMNHPDLYDAECKKWAAALFRSESNADDLDARRLLTDRYVSRDQWKEAIPHLTKLAEAPGASPELLFLLGVGFMQTRSFEDAGRAFRLFLDTHPDHAEAHFLQAIASASMDDFALAAQHAEDALELNIGMTEALALRIAVAYSQGDCYAIKDMSTRAKELGISLPERIFSASANWKDFFFTTYIHKPPQPLLVLNPRRQSGGADTGYIKEADVRVSVIVPTFNRPDLLQRALASVLAQTYRQFEIVVVNDAGTDVESVVNQMNSSGKIVYVRHDRNRGLAASRNTAIQLVRGKYIAYLDDDDIYYPDHLETLVRQLEAEGCEVAYTDACRAHQSRRQQQLVTTHRDVPFSFDFDPDRMLVGNFIPVLCVMHAKTCFGQAGVFDTTLTTHEDWDLWIRFSQHFRFTHIPRVTCEFSWRTDGTTMTSRKLPDFLRTLDIIYNRYHVFVREKPHLIEAQTQNRRNLAAQAEHEEVGSRA